MATLIRLLKEACTQKTSQRSSKLMISLKSLIGMCLVIILLSLSIMAGILNILIKTFLLAISVCLRGVLNLSHKLKRTNALQALLVPLSLLSILYMVSLLMCRTGSMTDNLLCSLLLLESLACLCLLKRMN